MGKPKRARVRVPSLQEQFPPGFDPEPTTFTGGVDRLVKIWETLRDQNAGGYGPAVCQKIQGWSVPEKNVTTCSPFTANVLGMAFDASGATSGSSWSPMYDGGTKPLPSSFYALHNSFYLEPKAKEGEVQGPRPRYNWFAKNGWTYASDSAGSAMFFGLGYKIEPKDMRRGDLVGINWSNKGGHAVFVWDVHLNDKGEVDCFQFISSNGMKKKSNGRYYGWGITIHGCDGLPPPSGEKPYLTGVRGSLKKGYDPLFVDRPQHIVDGTWYAVPGVVEKDIDKSTFKDSGAKHGNKALTILDRTDTKRVYVASMSVCRLYGFPPPERDPGRDSLRTEWERAKQYVNTSLPPSYATGKGPAPEEHHIENAPVSVAKGDPAKIKDAPPKKAPQQPKKPTELQIFVERALHKLAEAKWIDKGPGDLTNVNDQETKDAIKEFKTKWNIEPVDDVANPKLRDALKQALDDLDDEKPPQHVKGPAVEPKILDAAFLSNRIEHGGRAYLYVHGSDLALVKKLTITLIDEQTKHTEKVDWEMALENDIGKSPVKFPKAFKEGADIIAKLSGTAMNGAAVQFDIDAPVYIGHVKPPEADWPWDERLWTKKMRDIIAACRKATAPSGPFQQFEITQYGVKEKLDPGDVEVRGKNGEVFGRVTRRSLMLADIEGTMRLNGRILNIVKRGNVYEDKEVIVNNKKVIKKKPNAEKFDPSKSLWVDVTLTAPWGSGSRQPLVPFRTLALNPHHNKDLFHKKVYIKQLDGLKLPNGDTHNGVCICGDTGGMRKEHFDLFVGREDAHISIPSISKGGGTICEIQIIG